MGFVASRLVAFAVLPASVGLLALVAPNAPLLRRLPDLALAMPVTPAEADDDADPATSDSPNDDEVDAAEAVPSDTDDRAIREGLVDDEDPIFVGRDGQVITSDRIEAYLLRYRSPLAPYASEIVRAGRRWDVDPRLIVAISGTETLFGKFHHGHNAWGWDAPNGLTRWPSWHAGISRYVRLFASCYRSRDLRVIGPRYAPMDPTWAESTAFFYSGI